MLTASPGDTRGQSPQGASLQHSRVTPSLLLASMLAQALSLLLPETLPVLPVHIPKKLPVPLDCILPFSPSFSSRGSLKSDFSMEDFCTPVFIPVCGFPPVWHREVWELKNNPETSFLHPVLPHTPFPYRAQKKDAAG